MVLASQNAIDQFCDACWLEDGLSKNTLSAYRRDLTLFAAWLGEQKNASDLYRVQEADLTAYMAASEAIKPPQLIGASRSLSAFIAMHCALAMLKKIRVRSCAPRSKRSAFRRS